MRRMRVGCSLKTSDGLLDIWTSSPDYVRLCRPQGKDLLMGLRLQSITGLQTEHRASICEALSQRRKSIKSQHLPGNIPSSLRLNVQTINSNIAGEMIQTPRRRGLSPFTRDGQRSYTLLPLHLIVTHTAATRFHGILVKVYNAELGDRFSWSRDAWSGGRSPAVKYHRRQVHENKQREPPANAA